MNQNNLDASSLDYDSALYLLKLFYEKALSLIDAAASSDLVVLENPELDYYYTRTLFFIKTILEREDFKQLKEGTEHLFETLIGNEEISDEWEIARSAGYAFLSKIEARWLEAGQPSFGLPNNLKRKFDDIEDAIKAHRKNVSKMNAGFPEMYYEALRKKRSKEQEIAITRAELYEEEYFLEINNGEKIISFNVKKGEGRGNESMRETIIFKVLCALWEKRWMEKRGKMVRRGDYMTLDNLGHTSGAGSEQAAYKQIRRLAERFKEEKVPIEIESANKLFRIVVHLS